MFDVMHDIEVAFQEVGLEIVSMHTYGVIYDVNTTLKVGKGLTIKLRVCEIETAFYEDQRCLKDYKNSWYVRYLDRVIVCNDLDEVLRRILKK